MGRWGHGSRLRRQSIRRAQPVNSNILIQEQLMMSHGLPEIVCRETIFRCDLNCLSPSFCLPELLVLSSCSRTKLLLVESGGQVCHKQAAGASTMVVSRVITAPFVVIDVNTCPGVPTPPHPLHYSHPLPSVLCAQSPLGAAPLLLLPIINLFWWSLAPSLAVNPPYQWLICISTREKVNRYKTYSVKIRVNKC